MENFRIESLEINKIGAFEHLKMDFPKKTDPEKAEIHILTGENGTGKTTILEALAEIAKYKIDTSEQTGLINKLDLNSVISVITHPKKYSTNLELDDIVQNRSSKNMIGKDIQTKMNERLGVDFALFAYSGYRRINQSKMISIDKGRFSFPDALNDALNFDNSINTDKLTQWIGTAIAQEALSILKGDSQRASKYRNYVKIIEEIIEEITNEQVSFDLNADTMHLNIIINKQKLALTSLPDGLKSLISWIGDLVMRMSQIGWAFDIPIFERNFILFLDEIEVHLHPAWQRKILPVVQELFKNAQIFISTHSPFVVGSVDGAWVHKLKKVGAYAVLDGEPVLTEDAESYDTILEEVFGIKERFGKDIEILLKEFREITKEILKGNEARLERWQQIILIFQNQTRPDEIMSLITPQIHQINRIRKQVIA
ncbi:AAA family ATPase [Arcicella aquatica]|uniref:AAA family ATPase n=1 Tax=Arcicella aquatica TaxID=217141 RepID=A0ABU5QQB5_9BACT|nr:AAA family ATPase [Arcicella aquatica]MEA5258924.1 AAA family ATPase [Arcicella aquatica]